MILAIKLLIIEKGVNMLDIIEKQNINAVSISSRDIAEVTHKRHDHVIRDIENALALDAPKFRENYFDSLNRSQKQYVLPKNIALGIVSGYSFELRMKIINRLEELENLKNKPLTYEQIMQNALLLADKKVKELEHKIEVDKPKVVFADAISSTDTDLLIRDWAKTIGVQEKACRKWLIDKKLMFDANKNKENGKNAKYRASAYGISSGYIKQTETPIIHPNPSFPNRIGITVRITSKGQSQLTDKILNDLKPK